MVIGYQKGTTDAFNSYSGLSESVDYPYVDGVSITYGTPRKHIWTYALGYSEVGSSNSCPCAISAGPWPPSFVHENYYCESGSYGSSGGSPYYIRDPVWDGEGCPSKKSCCSEPNLPWFYRQIPLTSDKNLEARICQNEHYSNEGVLVREIKLYIQ